MRIGVIGSGAVGGLIAAELTRQGHDITLWARKASYEAITRDGITVHYAGQEPFNTRVSEVALFPAPPARPIDLGILCVKSYSNAEVLPKLTSFVGAEGSVLCVQNGVVNEQDLAERLGPDRVITGVLYVGAERSGPGRVECSTPARLRIGAYGARTRVDLSEIVDLFTGTQIDARLDPQIASGKWQKFLFNCGLNPLTALTRRRLGDVLATAEGRELFGNLVHEAIAVAQANGAPLKADAEDEVWKTAERMNITSSMGEDLTAGRRLEIELFTGFVRSLGERYGIATPVSSVVEKLLIAADSSR
jgi:2-dehydropantoate 2-reductase